MDAVVLLVALSGWVVAIASAVASSRRKKQLALEKLRPQVAENPSVLPVDSILNSLPLGVVVVDSHGREQFRNSAARDASVARHEAVLIDAVIERLAQLAVRGSASMEQMELAGPPVRVLVINAIPATSSGAVITVEDITERWKIDQVRTDFVANVSHELKTPVAAISVLAETLEGETEDEDVKTLVRRMVLESHRMASTIDDLLELSRIQLGGEMVFSPFDVNEVVAEAIDRARPLAKKRHVVLDVKTSETDAAMMGDRFQILSAVGNLVDNAIKYSDDNAVVTVGVEASPSVIEVKVSDQGVGIPAASLDRIFERFYRVDRARSRDTGGTGLGLSIVRHVVTNHGGEVNVRSREGEGSTFSLSLPRQQGTSTATMVTNDEREPRRG